MWSELHGPSSWLFSLLIGLAGALVGYLIFTVGLGIGDSDVFDFGGIVCAVIGVVILLPFVGIYARLPRRTTHGGELRPVARGSARTRSRERVWYQRWRQRRRTRIHARTSNGSTTTTVMITGHMGASLILR